MTLPTITALPTAPSRTDPANFATRGDAFVAALATLRSEINAWSSALPAELVAVLADYAPLASPVFTGTPSLPIGTLATTQAAGDSSAKLATTAFVAAALSGGWAPLRTEVISGTPSTVDFINGTGGAVINSTYDEYLVTFSGVKPSVDGAQLLMRTDSDGGASFDAGVGNYRYSVISSAGGSPGGSADGGTASALVVMFNVGNAAGEEGVRGHLYFWRPSAAARMHANWTATTNDAAAGAPSINIGTGFRDTSADVDAIRFLWNSGTFTAGTIRLFGRRV